MKVSELIKEIVAKVENHVEINYNHSNDHIEVGIAYLDESDIFQVWVQRATKEQLFKRELSLEEAFGSKPITWEISSRFLCQDKKLPKALKKLLDKVNDYYDDTDRNW